MKIAVAGTGYVGLSIAVLLAQQNEVIALNRTQEKSDMFIPGICIAGTSEALVHLRVWCLVCGCLAPCRKLILGVGIAMVVVL